ncbi:outer membrane protein [Anditalea andensis]|uniref:Uncharacterized protein n=1 Tax=Anditalea andensis TaxID=1048983 RepID=A0A074LFH4_9BACT|nr:hypothetical protein [Anditalea andensis]KEO72527.1 hypothetical protein EL17_17475 [Anditalea andensis]
MKGIGLFFICCLLTINIHAQSQRSQRSSLHLISGTTGANVREFNQMLENKGIGELRRGYSNIGLGYQHRFNDFVLGFEAYHNSGPRSVFRDYDIEYRSSRVYLNVGYSFTEEGKFHLIHYMSLGVGYMNFQMLQSEDPASLSDFFNQPASGFILRQNDIHRGSRYLGGFLTEIGFQLGYDIDLPVMEESLEIIAKFGYSFSPFEDSWNQKGMSFDNIQSGPFLRLGAGISLPDHNFFYRDASLGVHVLYGLHYTRPEQFNNFLNAFGYNTLSGRPSNLGLKILGENRGFLYGIDIYNLAMSNDANEQKTHSLNSFRLYGNIGRKLYDLKNVEMGVLGGVGYGNLRYTLLDDSKPDLPLLFEEPDHDGYLTTWGFIIKPEVYVAYAMPLSQNHSTDLIYSIFAGYEMPVGGYRLADLGMRKYIAGPYIQFGLGIRP